MDDALLTVRGITRRFGDRTILSGVDLDVAAGEAVGVVGPNGSGKSTLLRCIVGADEADSGEATLAGRVFDERLPEIRRDLAVVMDDIDFFPDLSVVEHLDLMARAHGQPDAEEIVNGVLAEVGLMEVSGSCRPPSPPASGDGWPWPARSSDPGCCWCSTSRRPASTSTACSGSAPSSSPRRPPVAGCCW